ncbi:DUF3883 domain-containing protein [Colwellia sp. Bg11-12]|uniref:DUF3883 domain-containing protein n=1 Tax=Colwellia sp. Bg11-12 TaxID=2759817 RepID=UPI0015F525AE|nr:DUF3883 domain-containing protein [Colwellia sp. Bg11-12]MBA6263920.1 DUF3883 domain-containing protein [Colwellia sp. Bg11-12]
MIDNSSFLKQTVSSSNLYRDIKLSLKNEAFKKDLKFFINDYDENNEAIAAISRAVFLEKFPSSGISKLRIKDYVYGLGKDSETFCRHVQDKTEKWARIRAGQPTKYGVYYGKETYQFAEKYGSNWKDVFNKVKFHLQQLLTDGENLHFDKVDKNPLAQTFKAKVLSLYYPEKYLNVCGKNYIKDITRGLGWDCSISISKQQHLLFKEKLKHPETKYWTNPKFMSFLDRRYIKENLNSTACKDVSKPRQKPNKIVDFDVLQEMRNKIGKISEQYALKFEKQRLTGLGLKYLVDKIEDRSNKPSFGYDLLSFEADGSERQIEVKTVSKKECKEKGVYRYFISSNEFSVSKEPDKNYHYYFVIMGSEFKPKKLVMMSASVANKKVEMEPIIFKAKVKLY